MFCLPVPYLALTLFAVASLSLGLVWSNSLAPEEVRTGVPKVFPIILVVGMLFVWIHC